MKANLARGLLVVFIAVLSTSVVRADEPVDPLAARLESEVLRYYRGLGSEPTEAEMKFGLEAAADMLFAGVAIDQLSCAINEAIKRHANGADVPFAIAVPDLVRALAQEQARAVEVDGSEAAEQPARPAATDQGALDLPPQEASNRSPGFRPARRDWKSRFSLEVERHQRDWGIITAVMLGAVGGVAGTALLVGAAGARDGPSDTDVGFFIGMPHLIGLGFLAHFLSTTNVTLAGIKGLVAVTGDAWKTLRRLHEVRISTGVVALAVACLGTAVVMVTINDLDIDWLAAPIGIGFALAALTLLSISSAHLALAVEFERLAAGGRLRSARKAPAVRVVVTPTGIVGWF